jgi:hypothetical protein
MTEWQDIQVNPLSKNLASLAAQLVGLSTLRGPIPRYLAGWFPGQSLRMEVKGNTISSTFSDHYFGTEQ